MRKLYNYQMALLSCPEVYSIAGISLFVAFLMTRINFLVGMFVWVTISVYDIYHAKDLQSLLIPASKESRITNFYCLGYTLFFCMMLVWILFFLVASIVFSFFSPSYFFDSIRAMGNMPVEAFMEILFCILYYQCSILYITITKRQAGVFTNKKKREYLLLTVGMGIVFYCVVDFLVGSAILQIGMLLLTLLSIVVFPILSLNQCKKGA